jgi:hypothetical protein
MRFRILNKTPLFDYRESCKTTEGIELYNPDNTFKPKDEVEYWIKQITANHSCIRSVHFRLVDTRPKSVIMQIIRATKGHPQPEVQSSRPDWTGKERSNDPYEEKLFMQDHTAESFVMMARQRLCKRTEEKTRAFMTEMVATLRKSKEPFLRAVGYCCTAPCKYIGACPEIHGCTGKPKLSEYFAGLYRADKAGLEEDKSYYKEEEND